jgi:hypothetical protein
MKVTNVSGVVCRRGREEGARVVQAVPVSREAEWRGEPSHHTEISAPQAAATLIALRQHTRKIGRSPDWRNEEYAKSPGDIADILDREMEQVLPLTPDFKNQEM